MLHLENFWERGVLAWQSVGIHMKIKVLNKYFKVLVCMRHSLKTCLFHLNIVLQAFAQYICSMQKIKLSTNILNFAVLLKLGHGIWLS